MALTTCPDCEKDVSTLAPTCPHCGRPMQVSRLPEGLSEGKRVSCPDGRCIGTLNSVGICRSCGKSHDWKDCADGTMICPHCHVKGMITTKSVTKKQGISGAKATGALLTGGLSILLTGLSRKEENTQARCGACGNIWTF